MTDAKLRKLMKLLPDMTPDRIGAALETVKCVEPGMDPAKLAVLIRRVVQSWEHVLEMGRMP